MLLGTLGASLFGNLLVCKGVFQAGDRMIRAEQQQIEDEDRIFNAT